MVYQMMAALDEHPEYLRQVADFLFMPEYRSYVLTGHKAHERTERTTSVLCDAARRTWPARPSRTSASSAEARMKC